VVTAQPARARVVVIGAGIAGLMCARELAAAGAGVVVVDKGRGVGGRMATRRFGGAVFDHGAQYFTARPPWFDAEVRGWAAVGVVGQWFDGVDPAWRGVPAMTAVAKYLAVGLEVHVATTVTSVSSGDSAPWRVAARVTSAGGDQGDVAAEVILDADAVVITTPVPQGLVMLDAGGVSLGAGVVSRLQAVAYDPCLAVLAVLDGPSGMEPPGWQRGRASHVTGDAVHHDDGIVAWVADNHLKGVSAVPALTVHCTTSASLAMFDQDADDVISTVMAGAAAFPGHPGQGCGVVASQLVRWRYARVAAPDPEQFLFTDVAGAGPLLIAGDGFGGPRVESAASSGTAAANALVAHWAGRAAPGS
jgi:renalase